MKFYITLFMVSAFLLINPLTASANYPDIDGILKELSTKIRTCRDSLEGKSTAEIGQLNVNERTESDLSEIVKYSQKLLEEPDVQLAMARLKYFKDYERSGIAEITDISGQHFILAYARKKRDLAWDDLIFLVEKMVTEYPQHEWRYNVARNVDPVEDLHLSRFNSLREFASHENGISFSFAYDIIASWFDNQRRFTPSVSRGVPNLDTLTVKLELVEKLLASVNLGKTTRKMLAVYFLREFKDYRLLSNGQTGDMSEQDLAKILWGNLKSEQVGEKEFILGIRNRILSEGTNNPFGREYEAESVLRLLVREVLPGVKEDDPLVAPIYSVFVKGE